MTARQNAKHESKHAETNVQSGGDIRAETRTIKNSDYKKEARAAAG